MSDNPALGERIVRWIGSAFKDLQAFPKPVTSNALFAIAVVQRGGKHPHMKILTGFNADVWQISIRHQSGTYRVVFSTTKTTVGILHCFQKKATNGSKTSPQDIQTVKARLRMFNDLGVHP